ncbi:MAG TPA: Spy/CpxP family protein refolding chaperone [Blastocatellia bacterium]|nr:Spy/CpxP family protein refolding chaperone [Blastocatellia bacterium]
MKIRFVRGAVIGAVLVVGIAVAVGAAVRANQGGHWGHGFGGPPNPEMMVAHMTKALGLSDAQATQVKQILADQQGKVEPLMARMEDADKQLRAATENGQFDEAKVREIAAQKAAVMTDMIVEHARTHAAIFQILTPDQREKAANWGPGEGGPGHGPHGMGHGF